VVAYTVGAAAPGDVAHIADIELAAARMLAGHAPAHVLEEVTAPHALHEALREGRLWVARADDVPAGYARAALLDDGSAHLEEIDVHPRHGRRGLGSRLLQVVCEWAAVQGARALTLTTFREVPFNAPFYARQGFEVVPPSDWSAALRQIVAAEHHRGLSASRRVVMQRRFGVARPHPRPLHQP